MRYTRRWRACLEEAEAQLEGVGGAGIAHRKVAELPYGEQRLLEIAIALALKPHVLLLDEPAAGVPTAEAHAIHAALDRLPGEVAILMIEHDMDLVFRFAARDRGAGAGPHPAPRHAGRDRGRPGGARGVPRAGGRVSVGLAVEDLVAGYGATVVLDGISFAVPAGGTLAILGRNGVGKTTLLCTLMGYTTRHRGSVRLGDTPIEGLPTHLGDAFWPGWAMCRRSARSSRR